MMYVITADGPVLIHELNPAQVNAVKQDRSRLASVVVAKKYFKVQEELAGLRAAVGLATPAVAATVPGMVTRRGRIARGLHVPEEPPAAHYGAQQLALVPYVPTTPHIRAQPPAPRLYPDFALPGFWWRFISLVWCSYSLHPLVSMWFHLARIVLFVLWFAPIVLMYVLLLAFVGLAFRVVSDPGILVSGSVKMVELGPQYVFWAATRMAEQLFNETATRVR